MWAIGDIHGQSRPLAKIIDMFSGEPFITLGDVVDRGPGNLDSVELVLAHASFMIRGNHEQLMEDALFPLDSSSAHQVSIDGMTWIQPDNGGMSTYKEVLARPEFEETLKEYLGKCIPFYDDGRNILTHAGLVDPDIVDASWSEKSDEEKNAVYKAMMWTREHQLSMMITKQIKRRLIVGHSQIGDSGLPHIVDDMVFMDTGASRGMMLSAINLETNEIISVPCEI